jgi:hypothetical protein
MTEINPRILRRFYSEQGNKSYGVLYDEDDMNKSIRPSTNKYFLAPIKHDRQPRKDILSQQTSQNGQKSGTLPTSPVILKLEDEKNDIIINSGKMSQTSPEMGVASHRSMKEGSQRFRWNLLFNVLIWLIVPLPFWIPFISNSIAYYLLPSIQGVFVFMWTSNSRLLYNIFIFLNYFFFQLLPYWL